MDQDEVAVTEAARPGDPKASRPWLPRPGALLAAGVALGMALATVAPFPAYLQRQRERIRLPESPAQWIGKLQSLPATALASLEPGAATGPAGPLVIVGARFLTGNFGPPREGLTLELRLSGPLTPEQADPAELATHVTITLGQGYDFPVPLSRLGFGYLPEDSRPDLGLLRWRVDQVPVPVRDLPVGPEARLQLAPRPGAGAPAGAAPFSWEPTGPAGPGV